MCALATNSKYTYNECIPYIHMHETPTYVGGCGDNMRLSALHDNKKLKMKSKKMKFSWLLLFIWIHW